MPDQFERTKIIFGNDSIEQLKKKRVAVFGIGGVGGYVCEALVRSGIGTFDLIDNDTVSVSNINRQIIALHSTVGRYKVDVMKERMLDINPAVKVNVYKCFFLPETSSDFSFDSYDYVVDAIDTVTAKLEIIKLCKDKEVPIISSMGTGNKIDPTRLQITDIYKTSGCPLAKVMRKELRKRNIDHLKVVFSDEEPRKPMIEISQEEILQSGKRSIPGSTSFVPSAAGLIIASEVLKDLLKQKGFNKRTYPKKCSCCGKGLIEEPYDICDLCGWEDDIVQNDDPDYRGGANHDSLNEHRALFERKMKNEE